MRRRRFSVAVVLSGCGATWAQPRVELAGVMGGKALLVIDGQPQMLAVGASARGVKLLSLQGDVAQIALGGDTLSLRVGGSPAVVGTEPRRPTASNEIVLTAGPGGHFVTGGAINGQAVSFLVDTGATLISLSQSEATRIGQAIFGGRATWFLTSRPSPATASSLTVSLNGVTIPELAATGPRNWTYDAIRNAVVFEARTLPAPGQTVGVDYSVACMP